MTNIMKKTLEILQEMPAAGAIIHWQQAKALKRRGVVKIIGRRFRIGSGFWVRVGLN